MAPTDDVHLYATISGARVVAAAVVLVVSAIYSIPAIHRRLSPYLNDVLQLDDVPTTRSPQEVKERAAQWYPSRALYLSIALISTLQVGVWAVAFGDVLYESIDTSKEVGLMVVLYTALNLGLWVVLLMRIILFPPVTPPWSSLIIYTGLCVSSLVALADVWYYYYLHGVKPTWASQSTLIIEALSGCGSLLLVVLAGHLRMNTPKALGGASVVTLDDRVKLWEWLSFSWTTAFIQEWADKQMQPEDLPAMSPTMQTANVFDLYRSRRARSLIWRLFKANYFDLMMDIIWTTISVVLNYLSPFFMKRILESLEADHTSRKQRAQAYIFASLALLSSTLKAVSDLLHLYHGRRGSIRIKSELIAAIYQKALKRKDTAGVINKKEEEETANGDAARKEEKAKEETGSAETGKVVNLMSGDANRIGMTFSIIYFIYSSPIEIIVAASFLYYILGWSAFAGVIVLAVASPLNTYISKRSYRIQKELLKTRDKRMTVMNELISGISFIKFFAWTEKWKQRATEARSAELRTLVRSNINSILFSLVWSFVPILVTLCSFFWFVVLSGQAYSSYIVIAKQELTISVAFTSIALFGMLRNPLNAVPTFVVYLLQTFVSVKRVADFMEESEVPDWVSSLKHDDVPSTSPTKIGFKNATLKWNSGAREAPANGEVPTVTVGDNNSAASSEPPVFELSNLTIDFPIGKLSVVSGPTGAGKTAILIGLLGEMDVVEGETYLPKNRSSVDEATGLRNSVSYSAQTPWLQQKSIKDNILFGEELDQDRYDAVVDACALRTDFDILEDGDLTEIGDKGVSLSGGQKARVALARAVYSYSQHVLLDDPLAAVDSHTAKHLVDKCFNGPLLQGRTIILVSHHLDLLAPTADFIVRILDGRVDCQGSPSELQQSGELDSVVAISSATAATEEPTKAEDVEVIEDVDEEAAKKEKAKPARKLVKDEERAVGGVKWATYKLYIKAATMITWVLFFIVLFLSQVTSVSERLWLRVWGLAYETKLLSLFTTPHPYSPEHAGYYHGDVRNAFLFHEPAAATNQTPYLHIQAQTTGLEEKLPAASEHPGFYLAVYAIISLSTAILGIIASAIGYWGSYRAAKTIHAELLDSVVHGTIRFFNTTPLGRIINRFSRDIETIDTRLNGSLRMVITYIVSLLVTVATIVWVVPIFAIPAVVISYFYYSYTILYLRTGRSLRRLEATARSPIYSGFAELLDGVISVRAFSVERGMFTRLCEQVDLSNSAFYYYWMTNRWLLVRFDVLGAVAVFLTTWLSLTGTIDAGYAGIAITFAQSFVQACYWVSRFWGELEMDFNSLERVEEYLHIPEEPPSVIAGHRPPAYWPSYSTNESFISARDLEIKYAPDLPTVFQGSFDIKAGEKIGLIGRTGSGKSTLGMALLRFTDPASGSLWLDGIDITSIGVDDLRSRITYIPQDAVLFSGTVRDNLDPFGEHSDADLIDALIRVNLITGQTPAVSRAPSHARLVALATEDEAAGSGAVTPSSRVHITLSTDVSAGGANFSQGQRQLVAMARALLRRSNLIIMDEATASVDFATDEALQRAIRSEFSESTVITIAHRLSSVIDYDRLLVLADGTIQEFDTPLNLLRKDDSMFKSLAEKSGKFQELLRAAERKEGAGESKQGDKEGEGETPSVKSNASGSTLV